MMDGVGENETNAMSSITLKHLLAVNLYTTYPSTFSFLHPCKEKEKKYLESVLIPYFVTIFKEYN